MAKAIRKKLMKRKCSEARGDEDGGTKTSPVGIFQPALKERVNLLSDGRAKHKDFYCQREPIDVDIIAMKRALKPPYVDSLNPEFRTT
jgi:hypothetical protein